MNRRSVVFQFVFAISLVAIVFWGITTISTPSLSGEWQVRLLDGAPLLPETNISLKISDPQFSGYGGCNDYGGQYELAASTGVEFREIEMTAQACVSPAGVLDQEIAYLNALTEAARFRHTSDELILLDATGRERLVLAPIQRFTPAPELLEGSRWVWVSENGVPISADPPAEIRFRQQVLTGFSGCRHFTGNYMLSEDEIAIPSLSMIEAGCDSASGQEIENRFLNAIDLFDRYRFSGDDLEIVLKTGMVLRFRSSEDGAGLDVAKAEETLRAFFDALVGMDYEAAAGLFAGEQDFFETLREYNPLVDPDDPAALLAAACLNQFRCIPLREIISREPISRNAMLFSVTFAEPDGSAFVMGACCGGEAPSSTEPAVFEYLVEETEDGFKVTGGLVYVP